jgi:hypothetical protein
MAGTNLTFSKVVATPTQTAWAQAYSAGSLFGALSLQTDPLLQTNTENLSNVGKDLISTLESEFFPLENKDLDSIKQAITTTISKIGVGIIPSFIICYLNENVLYLFAAGGGKAVLKRGEKVGSVLEGVDLENIKSASGYVQSGDVIVLQTKQFQRIIASPTLATALEKSTPDEIAEEIAPHVHDKTEGGASAVILSYQEGVINEAIVGAGAASVIAQSVDTNTESNGDEEVQSTTQAENQDINETEIESKSETETTDETDSEIESAYTKDLTTEDKNDQPVHNPRPASIPKIDEAQTIPATETKSRRKLSMGFGFKKLTRSRKIILIIGVILAILIIVVAIMALMNTKKSNNQELYQGIYNEAKEKYDEAESLKDLNAPLSQESLKKAQSILEQNTNTFPQGSAEDQKIEELLAQVNSQLQTSGSSQTTEAVEVDKSESKILSSQIDNPKAEYFTQNEDFIYFLDGSGANSIDKGNDNKKVVIKKSWTTPGGIGVFGSNIYVLDKDDTLLKFVPSGTEYAKNNYFSGDSPDLSSSVAMAIDGSVYILGTDGTIKKFTKGKEDSFSITGIDKPLSSPTRILTNEELENVYILDNSNSRVVVLDKSGKFIKAYSASILKNARDIDVSEKDKKILVLSDGKIYKIDIK